LSPPVSLGLQPIVVGTAYCIVSALAYTAANSCLRALACHNAAWIICVKESVTVVAIGPCLLYLALRREVVWPDRRGLLALVAVGLAVQVIGNLGMVWALDVIGLSITIPAMMGFNLAGSAILGWLLLKERVTGRSLLAIALLVSAIVLLNLGAGQAQDWVVHNRLKIALALSLCCTSGLVFAWMAVAIRKTVTGPVSPLVVVFVITATGTLSLGPLSIWQMGLPALFATPPQTLSLMLVAGVLNLIGFFTISKGLQFATVVQANVLGASQVAMAAVVGMLFFAESPSTALIVGVCLTIVGMVMIERPS
jgi:drug/metabolite transporter (DMT)-like permease